MLENRWYRITYRYAVVNCETQKIPDYFLESADEIDKDAAVKTNCSHMVDAYINGEVELKQLATPKNKATEPHPRAKPITTPGKYGKHNVIEIDTERQTAIRGDSAWRERDVNSAALWCPIWLC